MQRAVKENTDIQVIESKTNHFKFVPQELFNILLDFSGISVAPLLISKIYYTSSQNYWKKRITSDFKVIPDPQSTHLLSSFIIYRHLKILSNKREYYLGRRLWHPLNPAYIKSQLSQEELEIYGPEKLFTQAALVGNGPLTAWLIDRNRGSDRQKPTQQILQHAIRSKYQELAKLLVISAADEKHLLSIKLLSAAITYENESLTQLLLAKNVRPDHGILCKAVRSGWVQTVKMILGQEILPDRITLKNAIESQNLDLDLVKLILSKVKPDKGILDTAAKSGRKELVNLIMDQGIVPDSETLKAAFLSGNLELVTLILSKEGEQNDFKLNLRLHTGFLDSINDVSRDNHVDIINYLVVNQRIIPDIEILNIAAFFGSLELTKLILSKGVKPDNRTLYIAAAAKSGCVELVNLIMNQGIVLNGDILQAAAMSGNPDLVSYILSKGVKPDNRTLFYGLNSGSANLDVVNLIMEDQGITPDLESLNLMVQFNNLKAVKLISKVIEEKNIKFNPVLKELAIKAIHLSYWPLLVEFFISKFQPEGNDLLSLINQMMVSSVNSAFIENQIRPYLHRHQLGASTIQEILTSAATYQYQRIVELMMDTNQTHQPVCFTVNILNLIAEMGDESLVRSVLENKLQPTRHTVVSAINSGNRRLTKWLIQSCLENKDENPALFRLIILSAIMNKNAFWLMQWMMNLSGKAIIPGNKFMKRAVAAGHQEMVMWLAAEERGPKRVKLRNSHLSTAQSKHLNLELIAWLKQQLGFSDLLLFCLTSKNLPFSLNLFGNILSFLPKSDQPKLARTSKKPYQLCKAYWPKLTLTAPRAAYSSNPSTPSNSR